MDNPSPEVDRRKSTPEERELWKLRQIPSRTRAINTTLLTATGGFSGLLLGCVVGSLLAPHALAQSPFKFVDGGLETIVITVLGIVGGGLAGTLAWVMKGWVDRVTVKMDALEVRVATLSETDAYAKGVLDGARAAQAPPAR